MIGYTEAFGGSAGLALTGVGMVVTAPTLFLPFNLTGGTLTGFNSQRVEFNFPGFTSDMSMAAHGLSMSAAQFWTLTQQAKWHDIYVLAASGGDAMQGNDLNDFIEGWAGSDSIYGSGGDDQLWGNSGRDFLYGGSGNDVLVGNDWAAGGASTEWDECWGGAGDDYLFTGGYGSGYLVGGTGIDRMWGAGQSDVLEGGVGGDYMAGGGGLDVFGVKTVDMVAGDIDTIMDFQDGVDFIQLAPGTVYSITDSAYGAFLTVAVRGGLWGMIIQYNTAAQVADQIYLAA